MQASVITGVAFAVCVSMWLTGCATMDSVSNAFSASYALQLQIFLDSQNFGPGVVDGKSGEFTEKALAFYKQSRGLAPNAQIDIGSVQAFARYTITESDLGQVGAMASKPVDLAKLKRLPYATLSELLGERFHTTQAFIAQLNPGRKIDTLSAGDSVKVPNVSRPFDGAHFPAAYPKASAGGRRVLVDTKIRMLQVLEGEHIVAAFPITPGSAEHPAPAGNWTIVGIQPWPWYRYDEGVLKRGERSATFFNFAPGPNSPVGIMWAGLSHAGVGIHGTGYPETIGRSGSHGCIRLSNWDAATFYTLVKSGSPVTIR
ncbi:murein L,D-transpeptidase [Verrucomicrobia bacterium LW23]|nr:murein L,D-transpeptidase [Verrucomicrobia bacterium LW23]